MNSLKSQPPVHLNPSITSPPMPVLGVLQGTGKSPKNGAKAHRGWGQNWF
ncbi:hypothetical protein Hanom_Chr06g00528091 [Helianthus anomalus]